MVSDTFSFILETASLKPNPTDVFVSYDVVSLFTLVPLDDTIEYIVKKALLNDWLLRTHGLRLSGENLSKLLYAATRDQLFSHNGHLYEEADNMFKFVMKLGLIALSRNKLNFNFDNKANKKA